MMENEKTITPPEPAALAELARDARNLLAFQQAMGIDSYPATPELRRFLQPSTAKTTQSPSSTAAPKTPSPQAVPSAATITLADIREELGDCHRCPRHAGRTNIVFGEGEVGAKLFLVGEFPASEDAAAGLPFQGETGELLMKMMAAIGLNRADLYLATLVKCQPSDGHEPQAEEIAACLPFLLQQIAAVRPKVICAMGGLTAQTLLHSKKNLLQLRGTWHTCQQIPLMPTFAPAFLLRNPEMKKAAWVDLQLIQKRLASAR
ncbi:MAG TPA: uracil-DNA glycosylase [Desulfurivibrionaceae bacterium]|nr:uracil-DNA glycosylase [Desulfurivibrionaceae bacterium]